MSQFIQALESRTLLSVTVTAGTIAADKTTILTDGAALKSDFGVLVINDTVQSKVISADFKKVPKADHYLLFDLLKAEAAAKSALTKDTAAMFSPAKGLVNKSAATGLKLFSKATTGSLAALAKDITLLENVETTPLAVLRNQLATTTVADARTDIIDTLSGYPSLVAEASLGNSDSVAQKAVISAAATKLATDIATLATDLTTLHTSAATYPNLVGTFPGSVHLTSGKRKGQNVPVTLAFTAEDGNGNLTGTVTDLTTGLSDDFTGTVALGGKFILKGIGANGTFTIKGEDNSGILAGTFSAKKVAGTFSV